jgi:hypothetical protein
VCNFKTSAFGSRWFGLNQVPFIRRRRMALDISASAAESMPLIPRPSTTLRGRWSDDSLMSNRAVV